MWTFSKGLCILCSVTRIMVKTYNCRCNRNMYLRWYSNVYKRLQSFIWRYFYCAFLGSCLGIDRNVQPGVGKFGCIWLEWFARGQGIWLHIFEESEIPTPCTAPPPVRGEEEIASHVTEHGWWLWELEKGGKFYPINATGQTERANHKTLPKGWPCFYNHPTWLPLSQMSTSFMRLMCWIS